MSKIFIIGLSKTATNSVVDALKHFGYNLARVRDAIFLNHDDGGLTDELKQVISELFPEPSSYEK